jgi:hypothetical protein
MKRSVEVCGTYKNVAAIGYDKFAEYMGTFQDGQIF